GAHSGARPTSGAGPHSGAHSSPGSGAPGSGLTSGPNSSGRAAFVGPPLPSPVTGYDVTRRQSSANGTSPALLVAIFCFLVAIGLAGSAIWLIAA
uniref:hypothetical protein n=1 Tax=Nocardioides jensenii TaxID=1843 RepID=UPI000B1E2A75